MYTARDLMESYTNTRSIISIADKIVEDEQVEVKNINRDFLRTFAKVSGSHSDPSLQELLARILAEEAGSPGRYPKRLLDIVDKMDSELIDGLRPLLACFFRMEQLLCSGDLRELGEGLVIMANRNAYRNSYERAGVDFHCLAELESIGILQIRTGFSSLLPLDRTSEVDPETPTIIRVTGLVGAFDVEMKPESRDLPLGSIELSASGAKILKALSSSENLDELSRLPLESFRSQAAGVGAVSEIENRRLEL